MRVFTVFAVVLSLSAVSWPAGAQEQWGAVDPVSSYYNIYPRRLEYHSEFRESRGKLDDRRHRYQEPRNEALAEHRSAWQAEKNGIDYDAGVAGNHVPLP
ncbi:MAG: hypothetical protein EOM26_06520 [Alphaproteobacteria bacterium]|nr:hypothetical protein [Alphaproteobacteria bacterium]